METVLGCRLDWLWGFQLGFQWDSPWEFRLGFR